MDKYIRLSVFVKFASPPFFESGKLSCCDGMWPSELGCELSFPERHLCFLGLL